HGGHCHVPVSLERGLHTRRQLGLVVPERSPGRHRRRLSHTRVTRFGSLARAVRSPRARVVASRPVPARAPFARARRALTLTAAAALVTALPIPRVAAATDSLADAQAAITAAQAAADHAASAYDAAEGRYYELENAITATKSTVATLQAARDHLSEIVR